MGSPIPSQVGLTLSEGGQVVQMGPLLVCSLLSEFVVVLCHKGQLQVAQMGIEVMSWHA